MHARDKPAQDADICRNELNLTENSLDAKGRSEPALRDRRSQ